jgi:FkbM family methyltransferase
MHNFKSTFSPSFRIALADPQRDHNSRAILTDWYEDVLGDVFRVILQGRCDVGGRTRSVLDIGANLAIFTAASAAWGCRVTAVEAQTRLVPYIAETVRINGWSDRVSVRNVAVYDVPGSLRIAYFTPQSNASGWLSMAIDSVSLANCGATAGCAIEEVPVVMAHSLIHEDTALVKIDVDGPEMRVLRSLLPALDLYSVEALLRCARKVGSTFRGQKALTPCVPCFAADTTSLC